jgi:5-methylcytosine-specific restriction endonuclease McrA
MKTCSRCKQQKPKDAFAATEYRCRDCLREKARVYREANPDKVKESQARYNKTDKARAKARRHYENGGRDYQQDWAERNRDKTRAAARRHYARNADSEKARNMEWRRKNPEAWRRISNASEERRRAQKANAGIFDIVPKDFRRLYSQPCAACGATEGQTMDHIIPLSRGGRHSIGNLQTLCGSCNYSKNRRFTIEWRAYKALVAA